MKPSPGKMAAILIALATLISLAACAGHVSRAPLESDSAPLHVAPAFDLSGVTAAATHAFRADHGSFAAADATFEAKVAGGAIEITPRRADLSRAANALSVATSSITRGESVTLSDEHAGAQLGADGSLAIARGNVSESITPSSEGIEQSWRFASAPAGEGDLVIRVAASGQSYAARTDHGLHFAAPGSIGLRYSTATWVDARGRRTVVSPRFEGSEIVLTVPRDVVERAAYPAILDPTISAEIEVDQPISGSSASGNQYSPSVAPIGNGNGYYAVWFDNRGIRPALYGARISSTGTVIDGTGIPVATGVGTTTPFVSSTGSGFLVTWAVSYVDLYEAPGIYAVRLDADGQPLDQVPIVLSTDSNLQLPTSAWDGAGWLVAWQTYGGASGYDITGVHLPASGSIDGLAPIVISSEADQEYSPVIDFDGTDTFVFWRSYSQVFGRRYDKTGAPLTARLTLATSSGENDIYSMSAAFDGTRHLLVWSDYSLGTTGSDIFGKRISITGAPIDLANLSISATIDYDQTPHVVWDGTEFLVAFTRGSSLAAVRVSSAGGVIDPTAILVGAASTNTYYYDYALASDTTGSLATSRVFNPTGVTNYDVSGFIIGKVPAANEPSFVVSKSANSETEPVASWNGAQFATAWLDTRDDHPAIYGSTLSADGQPGTLISKVVSDATRFPSELTRPRIAGTDTGWLVVFYAYDAVMTKRGIWGIRLDQSGAPDTTGIFPIYVPTAVNEYAQEPDVAFDGTNYLVVWQDEATDGTTSIEGIHVPKTGTTITDQQPIHVTPSDPVDSRTEPSVAFDGTNYFVAWQTSRPTATGVNVSHIYGSRVSTDGSVLDGDQAVCNAFLLQQSPVVAGDTKNGGFMVVWEDYRTALETADVYGARFSAAGQNLDGTSGLKIAAADYDESRPHVSASGDGTNWVVAWRDLRSMSTYDIYGAWISIAGNSHDPLGLALSAEAGDEDEPWVTASTNGNLVLAYQRLDPRTNYGSYRARVRAITGGAALAATCTKDDDCASRSCANGVCCYTACGGCGTCSATPGTCTPVAAGNEASTCPGYKCEGTLACPSTCATDADCASNATCDPSTKTCVSRVICIDDETLKDLTGKTTSCAPYKCTADACLTQCGSVDDCATGFVCDQGGRCVLAPGADDSGCAVSEAAPSDGLLSASAIVALSMIMRRRRRRTRD